MKDTKEMNKKLDSESEFKFSLDDKVYFKANHSLYAAKVIAQIIQGMQYYPKKMESLLLVYFVTIVIVKFVE